MQKEFSKNFTTLDNLVLRLNTLSFRAKGVYAHLASKPTAWVYNMAEIVNAGTDGRDAVRAAIRELENEFLVEKIQKRNSGMFDSNDWAIRDYALAQKRKEIEPFLQAYSIDIRDIKLDEIDLSTVDWKSVSGSSAGGKSPTSNTYSSNTYSSNTLSPLSSRPQNQKREILKNKKKEQKEEDFASFRKKILKEYLGKNLIQGPEGFNSTAIISVSKTGYLHNNTSQKDLSSNDAIDVLGWIFVNQDRIGVFDYDCPTPVVAACKVPAAPKTEKVAQVDIPTQQEPKRAPERTNVTWDEVLKKGFYFRTADGDIYITALNIDEFEHQMIEKFKKNLLTPQNLKKFFVTDEYGKDAIFEYLANKASSSMSA